MALMLGYIFASSSLSLRDENALGGLCCLISDRLIVERLRREKRRAVGGFEFGLAMSHEKGNNEGYVTRFLPCPVTCCHTHDPLSIRG